MIEGSCHCGEVRWSLDGVPKFATACNCTVCRRYGVLWAYGHENEDVRVSGATHVYVRGEKVCEFNFCPNCGCVVYWRGAKTDEQGRRRIGVNLRLAEPAEVGSIVVEHLDGFDTWTVSPRAGRDVSDMWF